MEAASVPATRAAAPGQAVRDFVSKYGLIVVLLILPVYYAISDLTGDEGDLSRLGNNLIDGLSNGAIWALVAIGYTLVYGIVELINFAHGEVFMIGSFVAAGFFGTIGLTQDTGTGLLIIGLLITLPVCMLASGLLNTMIERVGYRPLRNAPKLAPLITAVGFSFILQNVGLLWLGGSQEGIADLIRSQNDLLTIAGIQITNGDVLAIGVTIPLLIAMTGFIGRSRLGKAMRATAQDPEAARLMGINVDTTSSLTVLLGGAVLGGLIIGFIQQLSDNRIGSEWTPAIVFVYLILIMVFKPSGLLGEETREAG
jgi:branched-chain amino acid transport system permease protein